MLGTSIGGPDAAKDWKQEEKGTTEDKMIRWHQRLDGHEFEQAAGIGDGQGSLGCCSPWGRKQLDMIEQLNWTELVIQWLRLCTPDTGGLGSIPGQATKSYMSLKLCKASI